MNRSPERGDRAPRRQRQFPKRPPRLELLYSSVRPFYFVTFNTHDRTYLLARNEIHDVFYSFCERAQEHNIAVGRYVIMLDHIHLFVAFPIAGLTLSEWIHTLKTVLAKQLIRLGVQKPHWQEGFFDHVLRSAESYAEKWEYVRMNPVRAGLCDEPERWPYQGEIVCISFD
jgi:REP element-mobilizing transposase RayT